MLLVIQRILFAIVTTEGKNKGLSSIEIAASSGENSKVTDQALDCTWKLFWFNSCIFL